jgi:hypothetical protein
MRRRRQVRERGGVGRAFRGYLTPPRCEYAQEWRGEQVRRLGRAHGETSEQEQWEEKTTETHGG